FMISYFILIAALSFGFYYELTGSGEKNQSSSIGTSQSLSVIYPIMIMGAPDPVYVYMASSASFMRNDSAWIYVIGGNGLGGSPIANIEIYNVRSNTWSAGGPLPSSIWYAGAACVNSYIFNFGGLGLSLGSENDTVVKYDINSNLWTTVLHLPAPRAMCGAAGYQDSLI